jgi:hypothetical protein
LWKSGYFSGKGKDQAEEEKENPKDADRIEDWKEREGENAED